MVAALSSVLASCFSDPAITAGTQPGSSGAAESSATGMQPTESDPMLGTATGTGSGPGATSNQADETVGSGVTGDATTGQEVTDWALAFDGDDFAISEPVAEATLPAEFSVELWLLVEEEPYHGILIDTRPPGANVTVGWVLFVGPPDYTIPNRLVIGWFAEDGSAQGLEGPEVHDLLPGWHHLAVTRGRDGTARVFVDGAEEASGATELPPAPQVAEIAIGRYRNGGPKGGLWWTGAALDDIHISRVARYEAAFSPAPAVDDADSVVLWRFTEGSGATTVDDASGVELSLDGPTWHPRE